MCLFCYNLVGLWLSPACYRRQAVVKESYWRCRCVACGTAWSRSGCGKFCLRCAAERARADQDRLLGEEAARHIAGSAHPAYPSEAPPAMDLLRWPRAAPDLPPYRPQADWLPTCHCRLCFCRLSDHKWPQHLEQHLAEIHGIDLQGYRRRILQDAMTGTKPTTPQLLRNRLAAYREKAVGPDVTLAACAGCARAKPLSKLQLVQLGLTDQVPAWLGWSQEDWSLRKTTWLSQLDSLLDTKTYWNKYFHGPERMAEAEEACRAAQTSQCALAYERAQTWLQRVELWATNILRDLNMDAVPAPAPHTTKWLLYPAACASSDPRTKLISCTLCQQCREAFGRRDANGRPNPCLGAYCRAHGLWAGPEPAPIRKLSWLGRRVLQLGRAVVCIKHLHQATSPGHPQPLYTSGNVHVFPQKGAEISRALGLLPLDLCCDIGVQFPGSHIPTVFHDPDLRISLQDLRSALWWYCSNNWEWMVATKEDAVLNHDHLGGRLEHLLAVYRRDVGEEPTIPATLRGCATASQHPAAEAEACGEMPEASAAFLDPGTEDNTPLGLWNAAMKKYDILMECESKLLRPRAAGQDEPCPREARARALRDAVQALQQLANEDIQRQLDAFEKARQEHVLTLQLGTSNTLMDSRDTAFWAHCFCDLFYRADCRERHAGQPSALHGKLWARALLKRVDFRGWAESREFAAVAANIFMRRAQMAAIHSWLRLERGFARIQNTLSTLSVEEFVAAATAQAGDFQTLAHALQCKPSRSRRLHALFKEMTVVLQDIDGSESHRSATLYQMRALRVWHGCSFLFFTLNPLDHQNPIFVSYLASERGDIERIDLSAADEKLQNFFDVRTSTDKAFFQKMAVKHPCAAMRCVRFVMERTIDTLLNCSPPANKKPQCQNLDLVASKPEPGVWQHVAAYFGVIETTKTLREHLHMLVHLVGFSHPEDLFKDTNFFPNFVQIWQYIASVCFHSEESFARYCGSDAGLAELRRQPLIPVTNRQKELLKHRASEVLTAQAHARGLSSATAAPPPPASIDWKAWPSSCHSSPSVGADAWARYAVAAANAGTMKFGNHVCLPHVCYKKPKARKGYCRMLYWHWQEYQDRNNQAAARRLHGLPLQPQLPPDCAPIHAHLPHRGLPALERTHPFHFKMTPAAMLGPCSNHDLSVLFRFGAGLPKNARSIELDQHKTLLLKDMIETITDHEYYTGGYMSKGSDHTHGLLHCLHDATLQHARRLAANPLVLGAEADPGAAATNAKKLFHRLIFALNKRQRMGFPSVYAYLFGKPSVYCSHTFVPLNLTSLFYSCEEAVENAAFVGVPAHLEAEHPPSIPDAPPASRAPTYTAYDYQWRPRFLEQFPLYFFAAGTEVGITGLPWPLLADESGSLRRHPCYERRLRDDRFVVRSKNVREDTGSMAPLRDPGTGLLLRDYDHYRKLRLDKPWRLPQLSGYFPHRPTNTEDCEALGRYALYVMLLFRPWRNTRAALAKWSGITTRQGATTDNVWGTLHGEYIRWQQELRTKASAGLALVDPPPFNSELWWCVLTYQKLRNFELVAIPKTYTARKRPADAEGNPLPTPESDTDGSASDTATSDHEPSTSCVPTTASSAPTRAPPEPLPSQPMPWKLCGDIGSGFCNHVIYSLQVCAARTRGPEATYVATFVHTVQSHGLGVDQVQLGPQQPMIHASAGLDAERLRALLRRQKQFFDDLDEQQNPDVDSQSAPGDAPFPPASPVLTYLDSYPAKGVYTPTCAIDAAVWIIQQGLLNVPSLQEPNVKQARPLIRYARC